MAQPTQQEIVDALLARHGTTYASEAKIALGHAGPATLWRLLCLSLLLSARISADLALAATRALADEGWTTPRDLAGSTWERRAKVLNEAGYARYDERTATMLGDTAQLVLDRYGGDLRRLREEADGDPARVRELIKECKGIGDVGADIFCREAQAVWHELHPFIDERALKACSGLSLPEDPSRLAKLAGGPADTARLAAALVRVGLAGDHDEIVAAARGEEG
jgi:endonuclease III